MEMIKLDTVSFSLLELPAIPYEQYIKMYGRSNMTQVKLKLFRTGYFFLYSLKIFLSMIIRHIFGKNYYTNKNINVFKDYNSIYSIFSRFKHKPTMKMQRKKYKLMKLMWSKNGLNILLS